MAKQIRLGWTGLWITEYGYARSGYISRKELDRLLDHLGVPDDGYIRILVKNAEPTENPKAPSMALKLSTRQPNEKPQTLARLWYEAELDEPANRDPQEPRRPELRYPQRPAQRPQRNEPRQDNFSDLTMDDDDLPF